MTTAHKPPRSDVTRWTCRGISEEKEAQMHIEVVSFRLVARPGPLKAYVDIRLGELTIRNWRIAQLDGKRIAVHPPQVAWKDPATNEWRYAALVNLPSDLKQHVEFAVLSTLEKESPNGFRLCEVVPQHKG